MLHLLGSGSLTENMSPAPAVPVYWRKIHVMLKAAKLSVFTNNESNEILTEENQMKNGSRISSRPRKIPVTRSEDFLW